MKRRNMKGKYVTDSDSENMDAEKTNGPEEETPEVLPPPSAKPLPENLRPENIFSLGLTGYSGPSWANPEILKDIDPNTKGVLLKSGLEAAAKKDENQYEIAKQILAAESENHKRNRWFGLAVLVVVLLACGGLSWLFLTFGAKELITPVLTGLGGLGAGFAGGYGFGKKSGRDS